jgi:hypothetical protein
MITAEKISELESKGFKRWTKNGMDRLYVNASVLGLTCTYYNTGNIRSAQMNDEMISNSQARKFKSAKTYIDLVQELIVSDCDCLAHAAADLSGLEVEESNSWDTILKIKQ